MHGSLFPAARWGRGRNFVIPDKEARTARRDRQNREALENQRQLRASIATSARLVGEAEAMIKRHRDECNDAEEAASASGARKGRAG
ncbi:MAG TPA: hypothetical protein VGC46_03245 [Allosphingosinicella sp.]